MADQSDVIREFLVRIGYETDRESKRDFEEGVETAGKKVASLGAAVFAAAGTVAVGATKIAYDLSKLGFASERTRSSATNLKAFGFAAQQLGADSSQALSTAESLAEQLRKSPGKETLLSSLGIQTRDAHGNLRGSVSLLKDLGQALAKMPRFQQEAIGGSLGISDRLLLAITDNRFGRFFDQYQKISKGSGLDNATQQSQEFVRHLNKLKEQLHFVATESTVAFEATLMPDLQKLTGWATEHGPEIAASIGSDTKQIVAFAGQLTNWAEEAISEYQKVESYLKNHNLQTWLQNHGINLGGDRDDGTWSLDGITDYLKKKAPSNYLKGYNLQSLLQHYGVKLGGDRDDGTWSIDGINSYLTSKLFGGSSDENENDKENDRPQSGIEPSKSWPTRILAGVGLDSAEDREAVAYHAVPRHLFGDPEGIAAWRHEHGGETQEDRDVQARVPTPLRDAGDLRPLAGAAKAMQNQAAKFFSSQGFSPAQVAGLLANIRQESGFNAHAVGDGGQAYGIAQWHADRQAQFEKWSGHSIQKSDLREQMAFMVHEMTQGREKMAGNMLRAATNAQQAGRAVSRYYERPAATEEEASRRGAMAQTIYDRRRTEINIHGVQDPQGVANRVQESMQRHDSAAVRNMQPVAQ